MVPMLFRSCAALVSSLLLLTPMLRAKELRPDLPEDIGQLLMLVNQDRADHGIGPLAWSRELAQAAEVHDQQMVRHNDLQHVFTGESDLPIRAGRAGAHFRAVAENIAIGPNPVALEREWMQSVKHRTNILDPRMNIVGIALVRRNGELWAVEDFAQAVENMGSADVERRVIALLSRAGMADASATRDARQTCEMAHGSAGGTRPQFIMRWQGSDLSRLPDVLISKLRTGEYRSAAVGVCGSAQSGQGFTSYHVAVLLY
jgi:hypothetical protein